MSTGVASLLGSKQSLNTVDGAMSVGGVNSAYHLYVYSGSDTPPLYQRGVVSHVGGILSADNATAYMGVSGWAAMTSGGFNNTGSVKGISMLGQGGGTGGNWSLIRGGDFTVNLTGTATATELDGVVSTVSVGGSTNASIGKAFVVDWFKGSTGVIDSIYGLEIEAPPAGWGTTFSAGVYSTANTAANQWGLYFSGTVPHYLAGALTVGGTVIHTLSATPATAAATGVAGTISWDASYIYICTATNTWKRVAIATW